MEAGGEVCGGQVFGGVKEAVGGEKGGIVLYRAKAVAAAVAAAAQQ